MKKNWKNTKIVKEISENTGIHPKVIHIVIRRFFLVCRSLMLKNEEINIKGYFKLKLSNKYKKIVNEKGKNINLRIRKDSAPRKPK